MTVFRTMSKSPEMKANTLFLGDLSCFCQENDITEAFKVFGQIQDIRLMRSKADGSCLGYGFITFVTQSSAAKALDTMNGKVLVGRTLNVKWATKGISLKNPQPAGDYLHGAEIQFSFVSKQSKFMVTEATIRAIFEEFGEIQDVCIKKTVFNEKTGQNGYGFVHYPLTASGVSAAIQASFIICQLHIEDVLYDCSFTHSFERFLGDGGFEMLKLRSSGSVLSCFPTMAPLPEAVTTTSINTINSIVPSRVHPKTGTSLHDSTMSSTTPSSFFSSH
jgi:RNA recognition motif-containing protein